VKREPRWLPRLVLDAAHLDQLREHGGLPGTRDENALEAALARPRQKWAYQARTDLAELAGAYGYGIARNHPYRDGNKRAALLATAIFLGLNGWELRASEGDVVITILALAAGNLSERDFAAWIRKHAFKI
jgi:death-on-curing protein